MRRKIESNTQIIMAADASNSVNCLPMCSLCAKPSVCALKRCGRCKLRTYCNKHCQLVDWKYAGHKKYCSPVSTESEKILHPNAEIHQSWCAFLDRDPEVDNECVVESGKIRGSLSQVITTGLNTCIFVVIKTRVGVVGWHASANDQGREIRQVLSTIATTGFVSGFIIPGEDRVKGTLELSPTCRTMREQPWANSTASRDKVIELLREFPWFDDLELMDPVHSYKDFVVFDMAHKRPFAFINTKLFDEGCTFDAAVDSRTTSMLQLLF